MKSAAKRGVGSELRGVSLDRWLRVLMGLVLGMVVLGGVTRLTGSGLSITEWAPILGAIPPVTEDEWAAAFRKYQAIAQYQILNRGISVSEFKVLFFWEYFHRLVGRALGLVLFFPLALYWWRGWLTRRQAFALIGAGMLGGLQAALGWFMVKSGIVGSDAPGALTSVSHFRLSAHLVLAFITLAYLDWVRGWVGSRPAPLARAASRTWGRAVFALVVAQVVLGAWVAGLKAGFPYAWFPVELSESVPWTAWLYEGVRVQWLHRLVGTSLLVALLLGVWRLRSKAAKMGLALGLIQWILGVVVVLSGVAVPVAVAHQFCAALLWVWAARMAWPAGRPGSG